MTARLLPLLLFALSAAAADKTPFVGRELLTRPTATSITVNAAADRDLEVYLELGTESGSYARQTEPARYPAGAPFTVLVDGLEPDTGYVYRLRYREPGAEEFTAGEEHGFHTQRPAGATFTFAVQFDPHMDENTDPALLALTLRNELAAKPDFLIDLGDNFMSDKLRPMTKQGVLDRVLLLRSFYDLVCHSVPLFLVLGNHEGEWGRFLDGTPENVAIWDTLARKEYFPNPEPGGFYDGDSTDEPLVGLRQAYYSWTWGDALFVVLDPYWNRPGPGEKGGDWNLTLGRAQYDWLKRTLEQSPAAYKFVFLHNLVGGLNMNGPMRGGIEVAQYLEWGGQNLDGSWGFDEARPGWGVPIHQLLVANKVTAVFHGHDHLYARQELDGIVYLEGPQPGARNWNLGNRAKDYAYTHGAILGGSGFVQVKVAPEGVQFDYIQSWLPELENKDRWNGMVADTAVLPGPASPAPAAPQSKPRPKR